MADPYPALGSNYRPPIETYTTNRGLTLTAEEVVELREGLQFLIDNNPESESVAILNQIAEKVSKL